MHETYKHVLFPKDEKDSTVFYGTCLYLKYPENQAATNPVKVKGEPGPETYIFNVQQEHIVTNYITIEDEPTDSDDELPKFTFSYLLPL
ncbi:hypothetical protein THARTR1_02593 [Trichoderma harzianum]|uniref:Uncharacterized protein n=1 Tax=Trichoderma harzianum TaxID=5544 RepID=A0A2K0UIL5_TRIHA|nr:hypothetical protein THARTR1_02593 [Trichoderma harzianum]